ncbi:hypothetical protein TanjilG_32631 [Lupinus angustifolius]|uniref:B box-type domain-containing protein n=1 Tax=Lupinus angustifolius TaxID=3871 RepID=A0A4P1R933_LUPAN|nr:PREDICTED: uncharacterized protein LOC109355923 [Lupinus angustifolius]XP_019454752.1 PREDICTED: uncharacterized protein LOC109355923 [Lupinus angustifolius]XP_019454754.1 PREDICTED: uncharacterized protein LOC109355923 [Lupinus angustifolius]XP_019454755.1 PREDICTED: uncharacterized protein LOC109355923 [Lupinus angustifolius]OIW04439.1 hypothetical protein TanjilG_32631 [Lupinus angustifolius]
MEMKSATSSNKVNKDEQVDQHIVPEPRWLEVFLKESFFGTCKAHRRKRNELNRYCINCNVSACGHCVLSDRHVDHKILKVHRYVYKDVVSLSAMEEHIDCSEIQPYKCNKQLVISPNPLPYSGPAQLDDEETCNICSRKLTEPDLYRYCSISCKVKAVQRKADDSAPPFILIPNPQEIQEETSKSQNERTSEPQNEETSEPQPEETSEPQPEETSKPQSLRKRKRKGIPHRAPFF